MTWPDRLARSDTVIGLDLPVLIRLQRVIWRSYTYRGRSRPDLPPGCPEQFDGRFLHWIWNSRHHSRRRIMDFMAQVPSEKPVHILRNYRDIGALLAVIVDKSGQ